MTPATTLTRSAPRFSLAALAGKREWGLCALIVLTVAAASLRNPAFLAPANLTDILIRSAPVAIVACGMTFVILLGEIDISVGSLLGLLAATLGILTASDRMGLPLFAGVAATLAVGGAVGLLNGLLVTYGRVPSTIVTLGMLTLLRGITDLLMAGEWITGQPAALRAFSTGAFLGVPNVVWVAAIVVLASALLARETPFGRRVYAVGSNPQAARLAGLPVNGIKLTVFALTGVLVALAALVDVPRLQVIESGVGQGFELLVVTCVVVGGTSISGGKGSILGTLLGVLLLVMVRTVLIFLNLGESASYWERAIQGAFILLAVLADHAGRRRGAGGGA